MLRFIANYLGAAFMRAMTKQPTRTVVDIELARRCKGPEDSRKGAARTATYNPKQFRSPR